MGISMIIPAYNEEDGIAGTIKQVKKHLPRGSEIIVVDDGSSDRTYEIAKKQGVNVLRHDMNMGKGCAMRTGTAAAKNQIVGVIDADLTYPADMIIPLAKLIDNGYDMVAGNRFGKKISHMPFKRRLGNHFINCFITILTGKRVRDATTGLRFWKKDVFEKLHLRSKRFEIEVEMVTKTVGRGYRYIEVPISYSKRAGRSKLRFLGDGIKFVLVIAASWLYLI